MPDVVIGEPVIANPTGTDKATDVTLLLYAVFHRPWLTSVGIEYPVETDKANVPDVVIGEPTIANPIGTDKATDDTDPLFMTSQAIDISLADNEPST